MLKLAGAVTGLSMMLAGGLSASPLVVQASAAQADGTLEQVKVICDESGRCHRPPAAGLWRAGSMAMAIFTVLTTARAIMAIRGFATGCFLTSGGNTLDGRTTT